MEQIALHHNELPSFESELNPVSFALLFEIFITFSITHFKFINIYINQSLKAKSKILKEI